MKRLSITTLVIGIVVAFAVGALHASKSLEVIENAGARFVSDYASATRIVGEKWQYVFILLVALIVAWLSLSIVPRWRSRLLVGLLLVELFALSWVCSLYRVFFQPIPSVLALVLAFAAAESWSAFLRRDRSHLVRTFFADRLSRKEFRRRREDSRDVSGDWDIRAGVSSGAIIAGALKDSQRPVLLASGEPIDLARRFCALNHFYGSNALIDTPTFDRVSDTVVARP